MDNSKDTYRTISAPAEGLYKEKGSKFLAYAYPVTHEDEIREHLKELKKQYYDARHHCYAFVMEPDGSRYRANDDGEPNHTAGDPILGQIRSAELTDIVIFVVRYFGGTKLGVPGLINAYKSAASDAIQNADIIEKQLTKQVTIQFNYPDMNLAMKLVSDFEMRIASQKFEMDCWMDLDIRLGIFEQAMAAIKDAYGINIVVKN